jgi:hypothetical protein
MSVPKNLYLLVQKIVIFILPLTLIFVSIISNLTNVELYKKALINSGTYYQISEILNKSDNPETKTLAESLSLTTKQEKGIRIEVEQKVEVIAKFLDSGESNSKTYYQQFDNKVDFGKLKILKNWYLKSKSSLSILIIICIACLSVNIVTLLSKRKRFWKNISLQFIYLTWHSLILGILVTLMPIFGFFAVNIFSTETNTILSLSSVNIIFFLLGWFWVFVITCLSISVISWMVNKLNTNFRVKRIKSFLYSHESKKINGENGILSEQESIKNRGKKYYQQKVFETDYDNGINNFDIPNCNLGFSYDYIELNKIQNNYK